MDTLLKGWPSTSNDEYPLNTISFIKCAARSYPEVEVVSRQLDGSLLRYNYGEAYKRIQKLANALVELGIKPGDRVAVVEWNTHRYWELYQAVSGIGAVLLQVNLRVSGDDRAYVLNHSEAIFVFVAETLLPLVEPITDKLETVKGYAIITDKALGEVKTSLNPVHSYEDLLAAQKPEFNWPMVDETSAYSACYTTGTTGKPKGVYYSHRCVYLHTVMMALTLNMSNKDVLLQTVPMFHANGWGLFFAASMVGAKLVFPGMYTAETLNVLVDLMVSEEVTINEGAPAIFLPMLNYLGELPVKPHFNNLRMLSGATEPPLSMMQGFAKFGAEIIHAYGATETSPLVTCNLTKKSLSNLSEEQRWELRKRQGLPICGLDIKIVDEKGAELPHDGSSVGEIMVRGPWITSSYYEDSRTKDCFSDGYWFTGDAGSIDENGYLKLSDRFKDIIKSGGEWISSIDLENCIMSHPAVLEAAVVGLEHPKWQERPLALVILNQQQSESVTKEDILDFLAEKFAKWQLPDDVLFVANIPKTSVGKISKKNIRAEYGDYYMK